MSGNTIDGITGMIDRRRRRSLSRATGLATVALVSVATMTGAGTAAPATSSASGHSEAIKHATVFSRGESEYHTFRIPAVVRAADGTLLAFAEGRVDSPSDDGDIDLVLKRSTDGGETWGPLQVVIDAGPDKAGNPVPVVDRRTGRVILNTTHTSGDASGADIRCGRVGPDQMRRAHIAYSDDHGATWSKPRDITEQVKPDDWWHFVGGPGHAIQLTRGEHAGRLVIPGNHSVAPPDGSGVDCLDNRLFGAHNLYSDDGGETWELGGVDSVVGDGAINPNENTVVELADGTLYFNARDQNGSSTGARAATTSSDGGETFDGPYEEVEDLVAPVVQGSVLKLSQAADRRQRLVFSAPGHPTAREALTLRHSTDEAETWQGELVVYDGPAGYSDLVETDGSGGRALGVLYENGPRLGDGPTLTYHERITFARVPVALLGVPRPPQPVTPDVSGNGLDSVVGGSPERVDGIVGSGLELAGDYIETPLEPALMFGADEFTAAAWFRTERAESQAIMWAHSSNGADAKWWIRLEPAQSRIRAHVNGGDTNGFVSAPGDFADGRWHHVALARGDDAVTLYIDGEAAGSTAAVPGSVSNGALTGIRVGARVDGINNPLAGAVDEVWMFDRALGAADISMLAADNTVADVEPVLHLPLDRVTGGGSAAH